MLFITGPWIQIGDMPNWQRLSEKIGQDLRKLHQHYTTSTKLYIARRHFVKIRNLIPNAKATDLMETRFDDQQLKVEFSNVYLEKTGDYLGELDAFFYSLRSCIDSFLWEINLIFELGCSRAKDVSCLMNEKYTGKKTSNLLRNMGKGSWFKYINRIRNNLIHRKLSEIATYTEDFRLYLPSNPKGEIIEKSYSREDDFEIISCANNLLKNAKEFLEKGYGFILDDLNLR